MLTILKRLFLKKEDLSSAYGRKKYGMLCSVLGIILNLILFGAKYLIGRASGSTAIMADGNNNLGDAMTNIGLLFGLSLAGMRGGDMHPGGHGRMEWIVGLVTSWLVVSLGCSQFSDSIRAIRNPETSEFSIVMILVLLGSILLKLYIWYYNHKAGKEITSLSMEAVALDSLTDSISTIAVLISVFADHFLSLKTDGWCGILVAGFIMYSGCKSLMDTIMTMLGKGADQEIREQIQEIVEASPYAKGMHGLLVHDYGLGKRFVNFYIEGDESSNLRTLHNEADNISYQVFQRLSCECMVGVDILITNQELIKSIRGRLNKVLHHISEKLELKELRVVQCEDHINVVTEIYMNPGNDKQDEQITEALEQEIRSFGKSYVPVVKLRSMVLRDYHRKKFRMAVHKIAGIFGGGKKDTKKGNRPQNTN